MRSVPVLPRHSLPLALLLGALSGLVFLGIGGRVAMRVFALLDGRVPGLSPGGTATVIFMGAWWGVVGGALLWIGRRAFPASPMARGGLFWGVLAILLLIFLRPLTLASLVAFLPIVVLYGAVLYRTWCRRFIAVWSRRVPATPPTPQPT